MKKHYKYGVYLSVFILFLLIVFNLHIFKEIISITVLSLILSMILRPLMNVLINKGFNRRLAAALLLLLLIFFMAGLFLCLIPAIFRERYNIQDSLSDVQNYIVALEEKLKLINNKFINDLTNNAYKKINLLTVDMFNRLIGFILKSGDNLVILLVVPIAAYYFLIDGTYIKNKILIVFPCRSRKIVNNIFGDMEKVLKKYFISQTVLCLIVGGLTFILLFFLKIRFPVLLSLVNGILNVIPYFGPIFGIVPIFIIALLNSKLTALYSLMGLLLIQQIEGNIIAPKITGDSVNMHPLTVILLLIIGSKIGGLAGMIFAVPIMVTLKIIYYNLNYYLF